MRFPLLRKNTMIVLPSTSSRQWVRKGALLSSTVKSGDNVIYLFDDAARCQIELGIDRNIPAPS
jgi:hypothetical protein